MAENFVVVCDMILKFHNLSDDYIIHETRKIMSFYLKRSNQDALALTLLVFFVVTNFFIISLIVGFLK